MAPIHLLVYFPKTQAGKKELAQRVADVHATAVNQRLKSLNCPTSQKQELLDAVIMTARKRSITIEPSSSPFSENRYKPL